VWCVPSSLPHWVRSHWVASICQLWEWSPSKTWLPVVEAPACPQAPNLLIGIQLLTTALLKSRLGAWSIHELPLLAAGSRMKTAPMVGKSWQPSHKPPRRKREGNGVGGELPGRWAATLWNARELLLYVRHVALCYNPQARGIPTHAHVWTPLTSRGTQVLFVVNSVKLHLNESCNEVVSYLQFVGICLSVVALESHSFSVDDTITMRLMKRAKVW